MVGAFDWSPDGTRLAFDHRVNSDAGSSGSADISLVDVASGRVTALVTLAGPDSSPRWSPDGRRLIFQTVMATPFYFFQNAVLAMVSVDGGTPESITGRFDENPQLVAWTDAGIFFAAAQRTWSYLYRLDPASRQTTALRVRDDWIGQSFAVTPSGAHTAFVASGPREFPEVYAAPVASTLIATKLSDLGSQVAGWPAHGREVVRWKSQDGAEIEGVLHKPADFQAGQRYPLLVVIHGGPTGVSRPQPYGSASFYPIDGWLAKGGLVLEPNYRGSAGYGEAFRSLNVRNLGIGDAWDVLSGIDHLVAQGLVDRDRVGAMGWSQGGYISAFLATRHSERFKALSVGAGISNWVTYYVNTDIHPFTRQYLKATPWDDPENLRRHVADDLHHAGEDANAHPAWRPRPARANPQRLRALSGVAGSEGAGRTDDFPWLRARLGQAESQSRGDDAELGLVQQVPLAAQRRPQRPEVSSG